MKHLTSLSQLSTDEINEILTTAADLKTNFKAGQRPALLQGHVLTQVFEKPSLRTRVSFEAAAIQLGGGSLFLSAADSGIRGRESLPDVARVLSGYSDAIVLRTFSQSMIEEFARFSSCPVINGLSDDSHPCQALADVLTMKEVFGDLSNRRLVYVGDGNNVVASLALISAQLEFPMTVCTPPDFAMDEEFLNKVNNRFPSCNITTTTDPQQAVKDADVVYTDVWASMGQESESDERKKVFKPYQINSALMSAAPADCRFMHCLPARRGTEVTDDVMDGPNSIAFLQAENRLHLAKGLLVWLLDAS